MTGGLHHARHTGSVFTAECLRRRYATPAARVAGQSRFWVFGGGGYNGSVVLSVVTACRFCPGTPYLRMQSRSRMQVITTQVLAKCLGYSSTVRGSRTDVLGGLVSRGKCWGLHGRYGRLAL
jgi:hypothetical protein